MTERKEKIAELAARRREVAGRATVWLTRDLVAGALSDMVDVWIRRPRMLRTGEGCVRWYADTLSADRAALWTRWTPAHAIRECRTIPDDHRQCVRIDGPGGEYSAR